MFRGRFTIWGMLGSHPLTHHLTHSNQNRSPHPIFYFPLPIDRWYKLNKTTFLFSHTNKQKGWTKLSWLLQGSPQIKLLFPVHNSSPSDLVQAHLCYTPMYRTVASSGALIYELWWPSMIGFSVGFNSFVVAFPDPGSSWVIYKVSRSNYICFWDFSGK